MESADPVKETMLKQEQKKEPLNEVNFIKQETIKPLNEVDFMSAKTFKGTLVALFVFFLVMAALVVMITLRTRPARRKIDDTTHEDTTLSNPASLALRAPPIDDHEATQAYLRKLYLLQEEKIRELACKPVKQVYKIEQLLKEDPALDEELRDIVTPYQSVVLKRCLENGSYCPTVGNRCLPEVGAPKKTKEIAIKIVNFTLGIDYPIIREVEVHERCTCQ